MVLLMASHAIGTASHGVALDSMPCHAMPWVAPGQPPQQQPQPLRYSMATPRNVNTRDIPMSTAPRVRVRVRVSRNALEVRGSFRGKSSNVLPQVVPRQCHGMSRKNTVMCIPLVVAPKLPCSFLIPFLAHAAKSFSNSGDRGSQLAPAYIALAASALATPDPATRSSAHVVLTYLLRLPATYLHDLAHRRPGQGFGEGASRSKRVHRDIVQQTCLSQKGLQGKRLFGLRRRVENPRPPSVVTTGETYLAAKSHPIHCTAEMYAVTTRHAHVSGHSLAANTTTASIDGRFLPN